MHVRSRSLARIALAFGVIGGVVLPAGPANAHAVLESTVPASSSVVETSPSFIRLNFNEEMEAELATIRLFDEDQEEIVIGEAARSSANPHTIESDGVPELDDGIYVVVWRAISGDGHPVTGAFPFQVGSGSALNSNLLLEKILAGLSTKSDLGFPLGVAKFLGFLGMLLIIGCVAFTWGSPIASDSQNINLMITALFLSTAGSAGVLLLQGAYASGRSWSVVTDPTLVRDVLGTRLGAAVLFRLFLSVAWLGLILAAARGAASSRSWMNASVLVSFLTIGSFAVSGHASSGSWAPFFVLVDGAHLASLAMWAGALVPLAVLAGNGDDHLPSATTRFSRIAARAMPVAVATGMILGLRLSQGISNLLDTTYGRLLLAKIVAVGIIVVLGAKARASVAAEGRPPRTIVRIEAVVVVAVLAVTSLLVGTAPGRQQGWAQSFGASLVQDDVVADVTIQPAAVGTVEVHALFSPPGGMLKPVEDVTMTLTLLAADIPAMPVELIELGPNHWTGVVQIPYAGEWTMELRCTPEKNKVLLFAKSFTVTK